VPKLLKALTLTQPWASLVATGAKRLETRSWRTTYTGDLVICAAKGYPPDARDLSLLRSFREGLEPQFDPYALPVGVALCVVRLLACVETERLEKLQLVGVKPAAKELLYGNYEPGRWAWAMDNVRMFLQPIPVRGSLGLWNWPDDLENPRA
jgi:hypothetical protein